MIARLTGREQPKALAPEVVPAGCERAPQDVADNRPETDLEGRGKVPHDVEGNSIITVHMKRMEANRYPEKRWSQNR
jgi:hypothetical protein